MAAKVDRLLKKAEGQRSKGRPARALKYLRDACKQAPHDASVWRLRASLAGEAGETDEQVESLFCAAELQAKAGHASDAAQLAADVLVLDADHAGAKRLARLSSKHPEPSDQQPATGDQNPESSDQTPAPRVMEFEAEEPAELAEEVESGLFTLPDDASLAPGHTNEIALSAVPLAEIFGDTDGDGSFELALEGDANATVVQAATATAASSPLLSDVDSSLVGQLIDCGRIVARAADEELFAEGDRGTALYFVLQGRIRIARSVAGGVRPLATLRRGAFFGEMALLTDAPRSATARAIEPSLLLEVERTDVRRMIEQERGLLELLMRFFRARLVGTLLATSPLFSELSGSERSALIARFRLREVPAGFEVITRGSPVDGLYVVLAGGLSARNDEANALRLGELGAGDVFGEISLLADSLATATVQAETRAWVLRLPRDDFNQVVQSYPALQRKLEQIAEARQQSNDAAMRDESFRLV